jgi:hypothetical protein
MEAVGFTLIRNGKLDPTLGHKALGLEPPSPNLARAVSIARPICRGLTLPRARFGLLGLVNRCFHVETREDSKGPPSQAAADSGGCSNGGDVSVAKAVDPEDDAWVGLTTAVNPGEGVGPV